MEGSNKQDEHIDEKEEKIKELEKTLSEHADVQHTLQNQVDHLQNEMRKLNNFIESDRAHLENLQNQVENNLVVYEIGWLTKTRQLQNWIKWILGRKQIANAKKSSQEKQVEENIMQLRINHIENQTSKETKRIYNLQKLRLALDQVILVNVVGQVSIG